MFEPTFEISQQNPEVTGQVSHWIEKIERLWDDASIRKNSIELNDLTRHNPSEFVAQSIAIVEAIIHHCKQRTIKQLSIDSNTLDAEAKQKLIEFLRSDNTISEFIYINTDPKEEDELLAALLTKDSIKEFTFNYPTGRAGTQISYIQKFVENDVLTSLTLDGGLSDKNIIKFIESLKNRRNQLALDVEGCFSEAKEIALLMKAILAGEALVNKLRIGYESYLEAPEDFAANNEHYIELEKIAKEFDKEIALTELTVNDERWVNSINFFGFINELLLKKQHYSGLRKLALTVQDSTEMDSHLTTPGLEVLNKALLKPNCSLEELYLHECFIDPDNFDHSISLIKKNKSLIVLNCSNPEGRAATRFKPSQFNKFVRTLTANEHIESLSLSGVWFFRDGEEDEATIAATGKLLA
ncbi:MAG: hypothetical protein ACK4PR_09430, partial [Gammaproteobacteria bacterium]